MVYIYIQLQSPHRIVSHLLEEVTTLPYPMAIPYLATIIL